LHGSRIIEVVEHTIRLSASIPANRRLELTLPADVPAGEADLVLQIRPRADRSKSTIGDLLHSEIFGMWADRTDIPDSAEFARELRDRAWKRAQ